MKNFFLQVLNFRPTINDLPVLVQGAVIAVLFGRLFYDSWIAVVFLLPLVIPWFFYRKKIEKMKRVRILGIQFRDAIASALTSLKAGYSIENAFRESGRDMELLYGKKSLICQELKRIYKGLGNNIPLEKLIGRLGKESGNADIEEFAEVFVVAKRSGGNMTDIIERTI